MNQRKTVIIADDHPLLRQGLRQIIEREPDFEILTEAGDGLTALREIIAHQPDVAVLDIDMPQKTGLEILRELGEQAIKSKIILLTVHSEEEFFEEAIKLGANGYLLKDSVVEDIIIAIQTVLNGQNYISPALTTMLIQKKRGSSQNRMPGLENLTPTERQILKLIADYKTNNQIAEFLFISPATVKTHRRNICAKMELEGNHSLMKFAVEYRDKINN